MACGNGFPLNDEDVCRVRFRDEATLIEHQRVVRSRRVRFDFGEDRLQQIVVMNLRVQAVRRKSAEAAGAERQAGSVVNGRLVLGQNDQRRPGLVQSRVHPRSELHSACQCEADVNAVRHLVGGERFFDLGNDLVVRRDLREGQCEC